MAMKRPQTLEAYTDLVEQALFETRDLRAIAEYDEGEGMGGALVFVDELEKELITLKAALQSGDYEFADEDLPIMAIATSQPSSVLPFWTLLKLINETHRQGLGSTDEN